VTDHNIGELDNHNTGELDKLTMKEKYIGEDHIHIASGTGMKISHIVHTTVYTPSRNIHLNNILYVPEVTKNLVSIHRLAEDNCVFVEFHPVSFALRIRKRGIFYLKVYVAKASICCHLQE
jgi:hypothetical protein